MVNRDPSVGVMDMIKSGPSQNSRVITKLGLSGSATSSCVNLSNGLYGIIGPKSCELVL